MIRYLVRQKYHKIINKLLLKQEIVVEDMLLDCKIQEEVLYGLVLLLEIVMMLLILESLFRIRPKEMVCILCFIKESEKVG